MICLVVDQVNTYISLSSLGTGGGRSPFCGCMERQSAVLFDYLKKNKIQKYSSLFTFSSSGAINQENR